MIEINRMTTPIKPRTTTLHPAARCEDCHWQGTRHELIWVKGRYSCYWRCPECNSDAVSIAHKVRMTP